MVKTFIHDDAENFFAMAIEAMEKGYAEKPFDYYGIVPGNPEKVLKASY